MTTNQGAPLPQVNVASAQAVTPASAPVGASLSGRERAGIYLTWGVLALIFVFLSAILLALWVNESRSAALESRLIEGSMEPARIDIAIRQRAEFRIFWLEVTKTILLNVFLPILTALLGYVFGTTQAVARLEQ